MKQSNQGKSEMFEIAKSPDVPIARRIEAVRSLSKEQTERLNRELISQLPGNWDLAALSAIILLGEVGDASTIVKLEAIDEMPNESAGKFHSAIVTANEQIRKRIDVAARQSPPAK